MGPRSENVEKSLVLLLLFEGSVGHDGIRESLQASEPRGPPSKKRSFFINSVSC